MFKRFIIILVLLPSIALAATVGVFDYYFEEDSAEVEILKSRIEHLEYELDQYRKHCELLS